MAITTAPIRDIDVPLAGMLQEQGLRDIPPELWQMYLQQFMRDQQGLGNVTSPAYQELLDRLQAMNQLPPEEQGQGGKDYVKEGIDTSKKLTEMAEKAFAEKSTGRTEEAYQAQRAGERKDYGPKTEEDEGVAQGEGARRVEGEAGAVTTAAGEAPIGAGVNEALPYNTAGQYGFTDPNFPGLTFPTKGFNEVGAPAPAGTPTLEMGGEMAGLPMQSAQWAAPQFNLSSFNPNVEAMTMGRPGFDIPTAPISPAGYDLGVPLEFDLSGLGEGVGATGAAPAAGAGARSFDVGSLLGKAGGALGALGGGYGLYNAITGEGDPMERAAQGALSGYGIYSGLNTLTGAGLPTIGSYLGSLTAGAGAPAAGGAAGLGAGVNAAGVGGTLGATAAAPGSGAALSGLGASATAGIVALPALIAMIVDTANTMQQQEKDMRTTRAMAQRFQRGLPTMMGDVQRAGDIAGQLTSGATPEQAADIYSQLQTLARNWQGGEGAGSSRAPGYEAITRGAGGAMGPSFLKPEQSRQITEQLSPYFQAMDIGRLRAQDIMQGAGMTSPPAGSGDQWAYTPESAARAFGSYNYFTDPESGSYQGGATVYNPWLQQNFPRVMTSPEQAYSAGGGEAGDWSWTEPAQYSNQWTPEALAALQNIQPGGLEAGLRNLFGSVEGENQLGFNQYFTGAQQLGGGAGGPSTAQGGAGGLGVTSGGGSDPEHGLPGIATKNFQAALGTLPNPWAEKEAGISLSPIDEAMERAKALLAQG